MKIQSFWNVTRRRLCIYFDVCGSVHHSIIHIEKSNKLQQCIKIYFIFIWSAICFGQHTVHHQEPKTALAGSGFAYVEGCWPCSCWTLTASSNYKSNNLPRMKTRSCQCSFRLLMMGGVSPETCWASYKYEIKFWYTVASCWIFYMNCCCVYSCRDFSQTIASL